MIKGQCIYDEGDDYKVKSTYDSSVYAMITQDCIRNQLNEFDIVYSASSFGITIKSGFAFIGGSYFALENGGNLDLEADSDVYVVARIDRNNTNGDKAFVDVITQAQIKSDDLNASGTAIRDLLLYHITTNGVGVSSVIDLRTINSGRSGSKWYHELILSGTPTLLDNAEQWDVNSEFLYYLDLEIQGIREDEYISSYSFRTDFEYPSNHVKTMENAVRFYFADATEVNTTIYDVVFARR